MSGGTPNLLNTSVNGDSLLADEKDDLVTLATKLDDDTLFDLYGLEPPPGATATNVLTGYTTLREGPAVTPHSVNRVVDVAPMRVMRSSQSTSSPRLAISALSSATVSVSLPTVAAGGQWRIELLYAQISYVDAAHPTKGTQAAFFFAPSAVDASTAVAPNVATLPANTSTTWNVPIKLVKNLGGATTMAARDIFDPAPGTYLDAAGLSFSTTVARKVLVSASGLDARRAYSSANSDPTRMFTGGASVFATGTQVIKSNITPALVGRQKLELVYREIVIPRELTQVLGSLTFYDIDDSRNWKGASFTSFWNVFNSGVNTYLLGEDDSNQSDPLICPAQGKNQAGTTLPASNFGPIYGNSHASVQPYNGASVQLWAAIIAPGSGGNTMALSTGPGATPFGSTEICGLIVDATTCRLQFAWKSAVAINAPITVDLWAKFPVHRP